MADVKIAIEMQSNGDVVLKSLATAYDHARSAADRAVPAFKDLEEGVDRQVNKGGVLNKSLEKSSELLRGTGAAGEIGAAGLFALATGAGIAGAATAILTTGLTFYVGHLEDARRKQEELDAAFRQGDVSFFAKQIDEADQKLVKLNNEVDDFRRRYTGTLFGGGGDRVTSIFGDLVNKDVASVAKERLAAVNIEEELLHRRAEQAGLALEFQAAAIGANSRELRELEHEQRVVVALQGELKRAAQRDKDSFFEKSVAIRDRQNAEDAKNVALAVKQHVGALELQSFALSASSRQMIEYNRVMQLNALAASDLGKKRADALGPINERINVLARRKDAENSLKLGGSAVDAFERQFGVQLPINQKTNAAALVDSFASVFRQFGSDPRSAAAFQQAFDSLVRQALSTGAPDIPELFDQKIGAAAVARLTAGLGPELKAALDQSRQAGQQWGDTYRTELEGTFAAARRVGDSFLDIAEKIKPSIDRVIELKTQTQATVSILSNELKAKLNSGLQVINFPVTFSESPPRPMSEFVPTMQRHFTDLNRIVESSTPNIDIPVRGLPQQIAGLYGSPGFGAAYSQYQALTHAIDVEQQNYYSGFLGTNDGIGRANQAIASRRLAQFQDQLNTLLVTSGSDAYGAARSAAGSSVGGANVTVNIDLRGSTVTPAALDETIIPALERGIIRATGQAPDFRVLN